MMITNPNGTKSPIKQEEMTESKKTLGIHDSPARGNNTHLSYVKTKVSTWVSRMLNGHLPNHSAWIGYKYQLWPGVRYRLGAMTNDLKAADSLLQEEDYRMLNVLGVAPSITKGLRHLHTSFGGFGLFNLPVEQLICHVNMLMQHYHTSSNLSKKLDASLEYLQLQLGTSGSPLELDFSVWGYLAPLLWVKMLWKSLHHFNIHLHMAYPIKAIPRERDQVVIKMFFSEGLDAATIHRPSKCRVALEVLFYRT
jgi:hypothetical protein